MHQDTKAAAATPGPAAKPAAKPAGAPAPAPKAAVKKSPAPAPVEKPRDLGIPVPRNQQPFRLPCRVRRADCELSALRRPPLFPVPP